MSEYIEIGTSGSDDGKSVTFFTNLCLSSGSLESYDSPEEMEEGSPLAQSLAVIPGLACLRINGQELTIWRERDAEWYAVVEDVTAVLKDFFL